MRLRYKFTFFIALIAVTISSLFGLVFFVDQNHRLEAQAKELASERLDNIARAIGFAMKAKDSPLLETEIRRALDDREVVSIQIKNGSGDVIAERAEDFDPNATWTKTTQVQLSDSTEGIVVVRFSTDVYVGNLAHNVGVLAFTTLMSIIFICLVSHMLFKNIVDTRLRKAISEVEGRSKNLRTLVACSKSIGSQTTLRDISQCIA